MANCIYKYKGKDYTKDEFYSLVRTTMVQPKTVQKYTKILFPTGNTASKVEGHQTLEEFKKQKEDRIKELEDKKQKEQDEFGLDGWRYKSNDGFYKEHNRYGRENLTKEVFEKSLKQKQEKINNEINQLKQEIERVETEGFGALRPIYNFYEKNVTNILKKQGFNPTLITDEYGNTWNEVTLDPVRDNKTILFNKEETKNNAIPDTELRNKYFSQGSTNDAVDVLKKIAQSDHVLNKLANHLIKYSEENNVQIELVEIDQFVPGEELKFNSTNKPGIAYYSPKENKIYLAEFANYKHTGSESTILHEILHSISYDQLKGNETAQDFYKLLEYARANLDKTYAMADEYEFLVALFTNAEFIKNLQNIPPLSGVKEYNNLFEEIFDYLLKVLGITKASNLYEQAFAVATNILENERLQNESLNLVPESQEYQEEEDFELSENEEPFLLANEEEGDTGWQEHIRLVEETEEIHNSDEILDSTPELDALINTQVDRLRNIQKELAQNKKGDPIKRQTLSKRMLIVENSIKRLIENKGYYSLLYTQNRTILNGIEVLDNESQEDFKYIQNIIEDSKTLITEIYKVHSELNTEQKALLSDLQVNLGALQNKYNTVNIKVSNKEAEGVGITYQPTGTAKRDIGSLGKWFLSAAEAKDIPELQIISKWLNYAKNKINEQISTLKDTIFRVKQNNPDWREKVKTFFDSKGKFIIQSTSDYYEEEKRINQEKDRVIRDPNSTSTQMALAFQSVRDWYIKHAVYSRSDVGDAKYEKDLQDFLSINEDLRIKNPAQFEAELYLFEQENSPQAYLDYIAEVKLDPNHYVPGVRKRIGYRNLLVVPNSTFDNPEYEKIKDDELYLLIRNTIIQAQSLVPRKMTFDVGNFDKVLNEFTLDMSEQDPFTIKGLLGGLGKNFTEWFTQAKEGSNLTFNAVDSQGNDISFVLAPDVKKFMESKPEDIFEVLTKFYEMAVVYDQNSKILPTLQLYSDKLAERPKIKTNKFGTPLHKPKLLNGKIQRDSNGKIIKEEKPEEIKSGLQNARDLALFTIKSQIFGETKADEDTTFAFWMDKLINYTRLLGIGGKVFSAINNFIIGKLNNYAWAAKGTDFDDKSLLRAQNVIYGNILKAFNIDKSIGKDAKKLALLLDKYNILGSGINKFEGDLQNKFTDIMYFLMTSGEYMIHSEGFIAKMMHTPLTRLDGKEGTLWDYIQINDKDEVTYNTKEYGEQNFEEISPNSKLNNWLYQYNEYRKSTQGDYSNPLYVNQYAWGRALMIFRRWLPQAAYQRFGRESEDKNFKGRFLSIGEINKIFKEKKKTSEDVIDKVFPPIIKTLARMVGEATYISAGIRKFKGENFEENYRKLGLQDIDIKNMQVNIREMRLAAWTLGIAMALGAAAGDGDDDKGLNVAINTANRIYQDLTFFASPTSAFSIIRNPLPIITTIEKFNELKDNALNYLGGGNDTYQKGIYEGRSKLGVSVVKATPGLSAIPSTISTINQEFSSTSYKYSK